MAGVYAVGGGTTRTPGTYYAVDPSSGRKTSRPLHDTHEYIHPSARTRLRLGGPGVDDKGRYECAALADWRLVVSYDAPGGEPTVVWKARFPERNVSTRVLPESPLWELERELCALDPRTYDYVLKPPSTGGRRHKDRMSRAVSVERGSRARSVGKERLDEMDGRRSRVRSLERGSGIMTPRRSGLAE